MKKVFILGVMAFSSLFFFNSCREQPTETKTVVVEKEVVAEKETEKPEGALERTAKKMDDKVNKKIDEQIDKIDDN